MKKTVFRLTLIIFILTSAYTVYAQYVSKPVSSALTFTGEVVSSREDSLWVVAIINKKRKLWKFLINPATRIDGEIKDGAKVSVVYMHGARRRYIKTAKKITVISEESDLSPLKKEEPWKIEEFKGNYREVESIKRLLEAKPKIVAIDTETQGLDWMRPDCVMLSYSVSWAPGKAWTVILLEEAYVHPEPSPEPPRNVRRIHLKKRRKPCNIPSDFVIKAMRKDGRAKVLLDIYVVFECFCHITTSFSGSIMVFTFIKIFVSYCIARFRSADPPSKIKCILQIHACTFSTQTIYNKLQHVINKGVHSEWGDSRLYLE